MGGEFWVNKTHFFFLFVPIEEGGPSGGAKNLFTFGGAEKNIELWAGGNFESFSFAVPNTGYSKGGTGSQWGIFFEVRGGGGGPAQFLPGAQCFSAIFPGFGGGIFSFFFHTNPCFRTFRTEPQGTNQRLKGLRWKLCGWGSKNPVQGFPVGRFPTGAGGRAFTKGEGGTRRGAKRGGRKTLGHMGDGRRPLGAKTLFRCRGQAGAGPGRTAVKQGRKRAGSRCVKGGPRLFGAPIF